MNKNHFYLAVVGASAGGLEALSDLLQALPEQLSNLSIIIAQHLSPSFKSRLPELLSKKTNIPVEVAADKKKIQNGKIYVTPANTDIFIEKGRIRLSQAVTIYHPSIDRLLDSAALNYTTSAIGIILSGSGSDGKEGIKSIKEKGGFTLAQDPVQAKYPSMPVKAINTQAVDYIGGVEELANTLKDYISGKNIEVKNLPHYSVNDSDLFYQQQILKYLSANKGTDFSNYKTSTISRRLQRRISILKLFDLQSYYNYILKEPDEIEKLYSDFLISVTSFFRDEEIYPVLKEKLLTSLKEKNKGDNIRIWIPACATGEEAYSIAITLFELLQERKEDFRFQIFATDIDESALAYARKGVYPEEALRKLDEGIISKYFKKQGKEYEINKFIRSIVLFSKHDVTSNPPFYKLDLISCRNLLIYLNQDLQTHVFHLFCYALNTNSLLLLGKSESIGGLKELFAEESVEHKIYRKKPSLGKKPVSLPIFVARERPVAQATESVPSLDQLLQDSFIHLFDFPLVLFNEGVDILHIRGEVFPFISLKEGFTNLNLFALCNEAIRIELRALVTKCLQGKVHLKSHFGRYQIENKEYFIRFIVGPLNRQKANQELYALYIEVGEVTDLSSKKPSKSVSENKIRQLEHELKQTKEHLQNFIEELESSYEELQSLNEELQSANEELQASNEELETSNEELQSANEEMIIAYNELQELHKMLEEKDERLQNLNKQFQTLFEHSEQAYMLLDNKGKIMAFNKKSNFLIERIHEKNLKVEESIFHHVPSHFLTALKENLDAALAGEAKIVENIVKTDEGDIWLRVKYTPISDINGIIANVLISYIDLTSEIKAHKRIALSEANLNATIENTDAIKFSIDKEYRYIITNSKFRSLVYEMFGSDGKAGGFSFDFLKKFSPSSGSEWNEIYEQTFKGEHCHFTKEVIYNGSLYYWDLYINPIYENNSVIGISLSGRNITEKVLSDKKVLESERKFRSLIENSNDLITMSNEKAELLYYSPSVERILGYDLTENLGISSFLLVHPDDMEQTNSVYQKVLNSHGIPFFLNIRVKAKKGDYIFIEGTVTNFLDLEGVNAIISNFKDISEKISAEAALAKNKDFYKVLIENSSDMQTLTALDGSLIYGSPSITKIFGYSIEEFAKVNGAEIIHPDDFNSLKKAALLCLKKPGSTFSLNHRLKHKDGSYRWCEGTIKNLIGNPNVKAYVTNFRDITERKLSEIERDKITADLIQKNKDLEQFNYIISHNLRGPVANIMGCAEILNEQGIDEESKKEVTEGLTSSVMKLDMVIKDLNNILQYKHNVQEKKEMVNLKTLIQDIEQSMANIVHNERAVLKTDFTQCSEIVSIKSYIHSIFYNLISNSIKYRHPDKDPVIEIRTEKIDGCIRIIINDNGLGIDLKSKGNQVFGLYKRFHLHKEGKGMGLFMVKTQVETLGGRISVSSDVNQGTEFILVFNI